MPRLLIFGGIFHPEPFVPAAFQGGHLGEPHTFEFAPHPGAGIFVGSGAVENNVLLGLIFFGPDLYLIRIFADGAFYLFLTGTPVFTDAHVDDGQIGRAETRIDLLFRK